MPFFVLPERQAYSSPEQRPGWLGTMNPIALKGRNGLRGDDHTMAPFQGWSVVADTVSFSGRACTPFALTPENAVQAPPLNEPVAL